MRILLALLLLFSFAHQAHADAPTDKALADTQKDLTDPAQRENMIKSSKEAQAVAKQVKDLAGSKENEEALYQLASEVMGNMKGLSEEQMLKIVEQAQKDPEGFLKTWSPAQLQKLKEISEKSPAAKNTRP
jgi:hypothetical protein